MDTKETTIPAAPGAAAPASAAPTPAAATAAPNEPAKPEGGKPAQEAETKAKPPEPGKEAESVLAPPKVPELDIKLPEGSAVDQEAMKSFKSIMSDEKLTAQERAQKVIDLQFQLLSNARQALAQKRVKDVEALKSDKDFGGPHYEQTVQDARSALGEFFGEDFSKFLVASGRDNDPVVVKGLARIRRAMKPDSLGNTIKAPASNEGPDSVGKKMFPNSWPQAQQASR